MIHCYCEWDRSMPTPPPFVSHTDTCIRQCKYKNCSTNPALCAQLKLPSNSSLHASKFNHHQQQYEYHSLLVWQQTHSEAVSYPPPPPPPLTVMVDWAFKTHLLPPPPPTQSLFLKHLLLIHFCSAHSTHTLPPLPPPPHTHTNKSAT